MSNLSEEEFDGLNQNFIDVVQQMRAEQGVDHAAFVAMGQLFDNLVGGGMTRQNAALVLAGIFVLSRKGETDE